MLDMYVATAPMDVAPNGLDLIMARLDKDPETETPEPAPKRLDRADARAARGVLHFQWNKKWAVRRGKWKLIATDGKNDAALHRIDGKEPETKNYAAEEPGIVAELTSMHEAWAKDVMPSN